MKKLFILLVLALLAPVFASTSQFQGNSRHDGQSGDGAVVTDSLWQRQLPEGDSANSVVSYDTLLVVPTSSGLYLLNTRGESLHVFTGNFRGISAIASGKVIVTSSGTDALECYALNGGLSWTLGFRLTPSFPTLINDTVFVTCVDQVYAVGLQHGEVYWISNPIEFGFLPDMTVCGDPNDSLIYAVSQGGGLVINPAMVVAVINRRTGQILSTEGYGYGFAEMGVRTTATLINGHLYVATWDGIFFPGWVRSINVPENNLDWEIRDVNTHHASSVAFHDLVVFAGDGLVAYDSTGQYRWTADLGRISWSSPVISDDGVVWVGNDEGELFGVDVASGLIRQRFQCGDAPLTSPVTTSEEQIVVRDASGIVYCFGITGAVEEQQQLLLKAINARSGIFDVLGRRLHRPPETGFYFCVERNGRTIKVVCIR